ncbi:MAG: response regulator [Lachnospiraceae bacterium]|nr:response regulator [Lachnospiraceae bacterium]
MLKVFLVEDEYVVRESIKNNIEWSDFGFEFCGEAGDGEVALSLIRKELPDIVITDIKMPFMDGLTLSKLIKEEFPWMEIILLTGYEEFSYAQEALRIGVARYLSKPISGEMLTSELTQLGEKIQEKKEERAIHEKYKKEMEERTIQEKQEFFDSIVTGGKNAAALLEEARKLSLDLSAVYYNILLLKVWSDRHDMEEYSNTVVSMENRLKEMAEEKNVLLFDRHLEGKALLFKANSEEEMQTVMQDFIEKLKAMFAENRHIHFFGGVGKTVMHISEIPESFACAGKGFAHRYLGETDKFLLDSDSKQVDKLSLSNINPKQMAHERVTEFLRRGDGMEVNFFVEEFLHGLGERALQSSIFRQYITMDTYLTVIDFLENELGVSREGLDTMELDTTVTSTEERAVAFMKDIIAGALALREDMSKNRYHDVVRDAISYIEQHYSEEEFSLNELASYVNFSPNHLSAVFRQQTGQPFIKYLTDYRITKAKELLRCTGKKSSEIAILVGYKDAHYFSYAFKKAQGMTPTQYRGSSKEDGK